MKYYTITKKLTKEIIGIGSTECNEIPKDCNIYSYESITESKYNVLNKTFVIPKIEKNEQEQ